MGILEAMVDMRWEEDSIHWPDFPFLTIVTDGDDAVATQAKEYLFLIIVSVPWFTSSFWFDNHHTEGQVLRSYGGRVYQLVIDTLVEGKRFHIVGIDLYWLSSRQFNSPFLILLEIE